MADDSDRDTGAFSEIEEAFFREGDAASEVHEIETTFEPPRASLWSRLFKRTPRAASEAEHDDDDWEWKVAMARARHATSPGI
ncbi:MAG: hypothetical protein ACM31C_17930 [Acidobacteriota bacterium]